MTRWLKSCVVLLALAQTAPVVAQTQKLQLQQQDQLQQQSQQTVAQQISSNDPKESGANTLKYPQQLLRTGVNLSVTRLSPNSIQLAEDIGLMPVLKRIDELRAKNASFTGPPTVESLSVRQDLYDTVQRACLIIQRTILEIDFTLAEISAEQNVYSEILSGFTSHRDKVVLYSNAASFITNGALWAAGEALDIPTWKRPKYSISSGTTSILAGMVPSVASMYALKAAGGRKVESEVAPNMLAKLFDYPVTPDIDYPRSVWSFLNQSPASERTSRSRKDQLIDRWVADANIPGFNNRNSKTQLDVLTASVSHSKGLSIDTLNTRQVLLTQLGAEIHKMKRMLLELSMTVEGTKQLVAEDDDIIKDKKRFSSLDVPLYLPQ